MNLNQYTVSGAFNAVNTSVQSAEGGVRGRFGQVLRIDRVVNEIDSNVGNQDDSQKKSNHACFKTWPAGDVA